MTNKTYIGGCLCLQDALQYLEEKNDQQSFNCEIEKGRVDDHLSGCTDCMVRMQKFVDTYNFSDDIGTMKF